MFGIIEIGETSIMAKEKNDNKGLVTLKITVTKQTAWHLNRWSAMWGSCTLGRVIDKLVRSWAATMNSK